MSERTAVSEEKRTGRCGPWEEKYQQLCKENGDGLPT